MKITILCSDSAASHQVTAALVQATGKIGLSADIQLDTSREARDKHGSETEPVVLVNGKALPADSWQRPEELEKLLRGAQGSVRPVGCESSSWLSVGCQGCPLAGDDSASCCSSSTGGRGRKIVVAVMLALLAAGIVFVLAQGRGQDAKRKKRTPPTEQLLPAASE